jgi:cytochrome c oxidase subunit II
MTTTNQVRKVGGFGLPGLVSAALTALVGLFGFGLWIMGRANIPTIHGLQEAHPERPMDISLSGHLGDWLFDLTTYEISFLFVVMCIWLIYPVLRHHDDNKAHKAQYDHGDDKRAYWWTAILAGGVFVFVDGVLLYNSYVDLHEVFWNFPTAAEHPLTVEVMGQQWGWNFRYPGPDGKFNTADDIVTFNDLHVPVGKPVYLRISSKDVIHSFYLPNFRIKQDAFPGTTTRMWFQAVQPGAFEIACAQHCGANHYKMEGGITVDTPEHFADWEKAQVAENQRRYDATDVEAHWGWEWEY